MNAAMRTTIAVAATVALAAGTGAAAVKTEAVEYKDGNVALEGMLAYDDAARGTRPLILVVHEWWGLNDYAKGRAKQLAELGYVAFAVDMYGKGVLAKVDYQIVLYGGAVHTFTNPASGSDPASNSRYDEKADRRSWQALQAFLAEVFT